MSYHDGERDTFFRALHDECAAVEAAELMSSGDQSPVSDVPLNSPLSPNQLLRGFGMAKHSMFPMQISEPTTS